MKEFKKEFIEKISKDYDNVEKQIKLEIAYELGNLGFRKKLTDFTLTETIEDIAQVLPVFVDYIYSWYKTREQNVWEFMQQNHDALLYSFKEQCFREKQKQYIFEDTKQPITEQEIRSLLYNLEVDYLYQNEEMFLKGQLRLDYQAECIKLAISGDIKEVIKALNENWSEPIIEKEV